MKLFKIVCLCAALWCFPAAAKDNVEIQSFTRYNKDGLLEVLLQFDIQPGWHIFAPYDQEFGAPLTITWQLPENAKILEESFSQPQRFDQQDFSFDGYSDKAYYKTTLKTDGILESIPLRITWQSCAEECIPGSKDIKIIPTDTIGFEQKLQQATGNFLSKDYKPQINWGLVLLMAFAGGMILNLMPCIFPILSIKIISLAQMTEENRKTEAVFYTLGVIASMLALAAILFIIRLFDASAGWGFQLQSPWFIGFMLVLFIVLSLLMLDVINFNSGWLSRLAILQFKNRRLNAFMAGLLAVLIASPCTAPFMGAAVGYALMSPAYVYFPVFFFLGFGYALPFTLLALKPQAIRKILPKPGVWMTTLKKILSLPLILTCLWLAWVLLTQIGLISSGKSLKWQDYSQQKVEHSIIRRQPVFIDFTAKWCITCLVNKKAALQSDKLAELVKEKDILLLRADATNQDAAIGKALNYYGRASVPLYIYYDGKSDDYLILPQILTPGILEEYLQ